MRVCFTSLTSEFAGTQELRLSRLTWSNSLPVFISGRFLVGLLVGLMAASCDYSLGQGIGSLGHCEFIHFFSYSGVAGTQELR
jgi:hypothetical protein